VSPSIPFARRVFFWAGVYGLVALLPMYFLEARIGQAFPPALNHPENYYGFLAVALAWQLAFLAISRDVVRFRPLMPVAVAAKTGFVATMLVLCLQGRIAAAAAAPAAADLLIGVLFLVAWRRTPKGVWA
jgi:hypothetical protein